MISELPLIFITPLSDIKVFEKDPAKFECEVSREPKTFRWLKGTQELEGDEKFEIITEGTKHALAIKSVAFEDEAKYMFEAEDKRTSAKLIIEGLFVALVLPTVCLAFIFMSFDSSQFNFNEMLLWFRHSPSIHYPSQGCNCKGARDCRIYC